MSGPWERYQNGGDSTQNPSGQGPWSRYGTLALEAANAAHTVTPGGMAKTAFDEFNQWLDKVAYNIGGKATDMAGKVTTPENAAAIGYGANVATQLVPTVLGGAIAKVPGQIAGQRLMQSAIKPSSADLMTGKAQKAAKEMLERGYNVSTGSMAEVLKKSASLDDEVAGLIKNSTAAIDKNAVADRLRPLLQRLEKQVGPGADTAAVQKAWTEFLQHPLFSGNQIPVELAHEIKKGTYKALTSKAYGEVGSASQEAQKQLARGLREEIAAAVPATVAPQAEQSALMSIYNVVNRRAMQAQNNNPLGLTSLAATPAGAAAFATDRSQLAKSMLARLLYSGSPTIGRMLGARTGAMTAEPSE